MMALKSGLPAVAPPPATILIREHERAHLERVAGADHANADAVPPVRTLRGIRPHDGFFYIFRPPREYSRIGPRALYRARLYRPNTMCTRATDVHDKSTSGIDRLFRFRLGSDRSPVL